MIKLLLSFFVDFTYIHLGLLNTENIMALILFAIHVFCSKKPSERIRASGDLTGGGLGVRAPADRS